MLAFCGGTYLVMSSNVDPFHVVDSIPPVVDGLASPSASITLVALQFDAPPVDSYRLEIVCANDFDHHG